jgi:hypothetical protein
MSERCDVLYCRGRATHEIEWDSEQGGTMRALRCEVHADDNGTAKVARIGHQPDSPNTNIGGNSE